MTQNPDPSIEELLAVIKRVQPQPYSYTHAIPITITCMNCETQFRGTIDLAKKWFDKDKRLHYPTFYCPNCPSVVDYKTWMEKVLGGINLISVRTG